jgi:hypothetical protein
MTVSFRSTTNIENIRSKECPICIEEFNNEEVTNREVAEHDEGGSRHPIHKECLHEWIISNPNHPNNTCPSCRVNFDVGNIFSEIAEENERLTREETEQPNEGYTLILGQLAIAGTVSAFIPGPIGLASQAITGIGFLYNLYNLYQDQ